LSQSKEGRRREEEALNESKADASKIVAPVFPIKLQETVTEDTDDRHDWNWNDMKHPIRSFNAFKRQLTFPVEDIQDTIFKLDCHTYRPHQVITEVKDKQWGSASEERMTFFKINRDGSDYCKPEFLCLVGAFQQTDLSSNVDLFLFDKERKLRQHHRDLQVENSDLSKICFVYYSEESKPIARIVTEEPGQSIHAFLTSQSDTEPHNHAYHSEAIPARSNTRQFNSRSLTSGSHGRSPDASDDSRRFSNDFKHQAQNHQNYRK
jgi:hypothetical protein